MAGLEGRPLRFGLVGTGPWAEDVHGPGLAAAPDADLVGVWGRRLPRAQELARRLGTTAYEEYDALLDDVDAVAFAVPPDVQAALATRAAARGRHLLLDKPVATDPAVARRLLEAAEETGAASVVFFTDRFTAGGAAWLADAASKPGWEGGSVRWLAALDAPGNPFGASAWRRERGALWDIGPHALSSLVAVLGPVADVEAVRGLRDLVHLVLTHDSGATSTVTVTLLAPEAATGREVVVWGEPGVSVMPDRADGGAVAALGAAAVALRHAALTGQAHPADLRLGVEVVRILAEAERRLGG